MNERKAFLERISDRLPLFVFLLCLIQPILDVAGYWQQTLGVGNAVTMGLRMALLGGSVLLGFLLSKRKRVYLLLALVLAALTAGHIFACMRSARGYAEPLKDLINLVRIYFLPLMTLCFITFLRRNERVFPALLKAMVIDIFLIAGVQLLSTLTGTDPHTYSVDGIGVLGWFLWTNSQSAILAMLLPITICWAVRRWEDRLLPIALATAISEATLFVLAPRLAYASLVGAGLGVAICLLIADRSRWRQVLAVALVTCLFVAAYPISATQKRLSVNDNRAVETEKKIEQMDIKIEIVTETVSESSDGSGMKPENQKPAKQTVRLDEKNAQKLEKLYRSQDIIWSMVERFGRDRVFKIYNYTLDPAILANTRQMKINFCHLAMEDAGTLSHLFGLNLAEITAQRYDAKGVLVTDNYDVENDFHGVYFLTGVVGLALMGLFLLYFGLRALIAILREPKKRFTPEMVAFGLAYGLGLLHAYFTASVLRRNNASIYLAVVLAGLWYLSRRSKDESRQSAAPNGSE